MTWDALRGRAEILTTVAEQLDLVPDGRLPMDAPGVQESFRDELDLVAALSLRWSTRLNAHLERAMDKQPMDPAAAAAGAWAAAAAENPGARAVLDRCYLDPVSETMARALSRAEQKESARLALAAGLASVPTDQAVRVGRDLVERARRLSASPQSAAPARRRSARTPAPQPTSSRDGLVRRIKAALAA